MVMLYWICLRRMIIDEIQSINQVNRRSHNIMMSATLLPGFPLLNGTQFLILSDGRLGVRVCLNGNPLSFLHIEQFRLCALAISLPLGTQCF